MTAWASRPAAPDQGSARPARGGPATPTGSRRPVPNTSVEALPLLTGGSRGGAPTEVLHWAGPSAVKAGAEPGGGGAPRRGGPPPPTRFRDNPHTPAEPPTSGQGP